jgi:hypothetical protein
VGNVVVGFRVRHRLRLRRGRQAHVGQRFGDVDAPDRLAARERGDRARDAAHARLAKLVELHRHRRIGHEPPGWFVETVGNGAPEVILGRFNARRDLAGALGRGRQAQIDVGRFGDFEIEVERRRRARVGVEALASTDPATGGDQRVDLGAASDELQRVIGDRSDLERALGDLLAGDRGEIVGVERRCLVDDGQPLVRRHGAEHEQVELARVAGACRKASHAAILPASRASSAYSSSVLLARK